MVIAEKPIVSTAPCDEGGECGATCLCTDSGTRCDCACAEDGDVCDHGEKTKPAPQRRRRSKSKAAQVKLPVPVDELPEYKDAVAWAVDVRVKAEKEIAREAENISPGAIRRLKALADRGVITQRGFELVELWDGVGARGRRPGEGDYHSIRELLKSLSSLPDVDASITDWWLNAIRSRWIRREQPSVNFYLLIEGHRECRSESALGMREVLRSALKDMLGGLPTPVQVLEFLHGESDEVELSRLVKFVNAVEWRRDRVETDGYDSRRRFSVAEVHKIFSDADRSDFTVDCGVVGTVEEMREAVVKFGKRLRACPRCTNWFAVEASRADSYWHQPDCPGCERGDEPIRFSNTPMHERTAEERLVGGIDKWTRGNGNIATKVAIKNGVTILDARRKLIGEKVPTDYSVLETCPLAKDCPTLCGEMQTKGERNVPLTPENGKFDHCHIYSFYGMTEGMDAENRELVAGKFIDQINETARVERERSEALAKEKARQPADEETTANANASETAEQAASAGSGKDMAVQTNLF